MTLLTDERLAFMRAIADNPKDDAPRLIYADWLEEQGNEWDDARAELIRVGMRIAQGERANDGELFDYLIRRQELLSQGFQSVGVITGEMEELLGGTDVVFVRQVRERPRQQMVYYETSDHNKHLRRVLYSVSRGFPSIIYTQFAEWESFGAALCTTYPIERVEIIGLDVQPVMTADQGVEYGFVLPEDDPRDFDYFRKLIPNYVQRHIMGIGLKSHDEAYKFMSDELLRIAKK